MIHIHVPSIPPSANNAYHTQMKRAGKRTIPIRVLSEEGKAYKLETSTYITQHFPRELKYFTKNKPYALFVTFIFGEKTTLYNSGYPAKTDARYKKLDVSNRQKLFEDALTEATDIDDSHHWLVILSKLHGPADATHVLAWNMEDDPGPFTNVAESLRSIVQI